MTTSPDPRRGKDLARIHMAAAQLGLDDETYRDCLFDLTGQRSAAALDAKQRWKVLRHLSRAGAKAAQGPYPSKPTIVRADKAALIGKIEAYLAEAGRPWAYVHAMARRMFKREQVQLCDPDELHRLVAALAIDAKRHDREP